MRAGHGLQVKEKIQGRMLICTKVHLLVLCFEESECAAILCARRGRLDMDKKTHGVGPHVVKMLQDTHAHRVR